MRPLLILPSFLALILVLTPAPSRKKPILKVGTSEPYLAITIDIAKGNSAIDLLDKLQDLGITVTFFLSGVWAQTHQEDVKEMIIRGHEVGNHSTTHPDFRTLLPQQARWEIAATDNVIESITGIKPRFFRFPYGRYNNDLLKISKATGHQAIQWSIDSKDCKGLLTNSGVDAIMERVEPGAILLFHASEQTIENISEVVAKIREKGFEMVTLSELITPSGTHPKNRRDRNLAQLP